MPSMFSTVQDASVDFSKTIKELRGIYEDPEDIADGQRKVTGKITCGRVNINQLNILAFGEDPANFVTGAALTSNLEPQTVGASPTATFTVDNGATFVQDLGVSYAGTRYQLVPVASDPEQGEYTVDTSTGEYTLNDLDGGVDVLVSYTYTVTTGHTLTVHNKIMGSSRPSFAAYLTNQYDGNNDLVLFYCKITKVSAAIKVDDYIKMEFDFMAAANADGQTFQWITSY